MQLGTGSLCLGLLKGLDATWKGLKGTTHLNLPAIIAQPGLVKRDRFLCRKCRGQTEMEIVAKCRFETSLRDYPAVWQAIPLSLRLLASQGSEAVICFL